MWEENRMPHKTETTNTPDKTSVTVLMRSKMLFFRDAAPYSAIFLVTPTLVPREVAMDNTWKKLFSCERRPTPWGPKVTARTLIFPILTRVFSTLEAPDRAVAFISFLILPLLQYQMMGSLQRAIHSTVWERCNSSHRTFEPVAASSRFYTPNLMKN